jgi:nucleotide-binding universal stress UspA family protein
MLVAIDFSDASLHALGFAVAFGEQLGVPVRALHVVHAERLPYESHYAVPEYLPGMVDAATADLKAAVEKMPGVRTTVRTGIPYSEILEEAEASDVDLVAVGVHGHNPIEAAVLGSTTNHVIRRAHRPVLVVR